MLYKRSNAVLVDRSNLILILFLSGVPPRDILPLTSRLR